jgi:short-subunit dehydrogenase
VTDRDAVREAVRRAADAQGPATTLIANAGGAETTDVAHFRAAHVARVVELNVLGVAHCIEAVLPGMLARRQGHLVAVSSLAGYRGLPGSAAYSAAKAALTSMMESLRIDLRGSGVDVTVIAPGFVRTKATAKRKKNRPFRLELEPATARMHRAIQERRSYYAFPTSLALLVRIGWMLPARVYDRIVAGRGPQVRGR